MKHTLRHLLHADRDSFCFALSSLSYQRFYVSYGWINGWMDGWMDEWMDGSMDGWSRWIQMDTDGYRWMQMDIDGYRWT